jgi:hypothetical protein
MIKLRKFLCTCFAQVALLFLLVSVGTTPRMFTLGEGASTGNFQSNAGNDFSLQLAAIFFHLLARVIFALPLILAALYGMAWWTVKTGKPSGRWWAIAASIAMVLQGIPQLALTIYFWTEARGLAFEGLIVLDLITLGIGVPGLIAFWPRNSMATTGAAVSVPRVAGDGTSLILDSIAVVVQIAGYLYGMHLWSRWGRTEGLSEIRGASFWLLFGAVIVFTIVVHELGHALVGLALGMRLRSFIVGPLQWRVSDGGWTFQFVAAQILCTRGGAGVVPASAHQSRWDEICMIAAGPAVNLFTGMLGLCAALSAPGQPWERYWYLLAIFATLSFTTCAGNLIPFRPDASYSDGARIYQLLRGGPLSDLQRAFNLAAATQVTPVRPRDYDLAAIQRATAHFTEGQQAMLLRLVGAECFLDRGAMQECCTELSAAEQIYWQSAPDAPADWLALFVFGNALLRRDAAGARQWWERMEAAKDRKVGVNGWLAQSALFWVEGNARAAMDACAQGDAAAKNPPACGSDAFDLYRLDLLRRTIGFPAHVEAAAS